MRTLLLIFLAALLAASQPVSAQTLDDATRAFEKKEYEKSRDILEKLSGQGITEAEFRLAGMYIRATGIPRNVERGIALYESAAMKGNVEAKFFLATELIKGVLIPADRKRAVAMFRTAAKQKHGGAQYALCMELSTEGSKFYDAVEAYAWCEASSKKEHGQSGDAARRGKATLENIQFKKGAEVVLDAKKRAVEYARLY